MTANQIRVVALCTLGIVVGLVRIFTIGAVPARVTFDSCDEAREVGAVLPLHQGDVGWNARLDPDGDGAAC